MLHTDFPQRAEVDSILRVRTPWCVSLYLPTDPSSDGEAERLELRSLGTEAISQVRAAGGDDADLTGLEEQFDDLGSDTAFWQYQARSLALFATPSSLVSYRLPNHLQRQVEVSDRFHVSPLLRALTFPQTAFILALAQGSVRVLEILPDGPVLQVTVPDLPTDLDSVSSRAWSAGQPLPLRFRGREGQKIRTRQFAHRVDQALRQVLPGQGVPLILVAAEPVRSMFRSVCSYPDLAPADVAANPENMADGELVTRARDVLDEWNVSRLGTARDQYEQRSGQAGTATDVAEIARLATQGAVSTLFVDIDADLPGSIDEETGAVIFEETDDAGAYDVVDEITRRVWLSGGQVLAVRRDEVPGGSSLAAILRYSPEVRDAP